MGGSTYLPLFCRTFLRSSSVHFSVSVVFLGCFWSRESPFIAFLLSFLLLYSILSPPFTVIRQRQ